MLSNKTNYAKLLLSAVFLLILFCSGNETFAQGRDRSKFQGGFVDTSISYLDTSLIKDTTRVTGPVDSTARVKNFKYERKDEPIPSFGEYRSPLILYGSGRIEYSVTFDSLSNAVITESFDGEQYKAPRIIPLEKYLEIRSRLSNQNQFYKIIADFYEIETEDDLTKLFKSITEITIPLPFATETIFGPPTINLKLNGTVDITASYQRSTNDLQTIYAESQKQNNINFKQEVQVTTKGTVGDKLTIDADWNSQRTFEFENQLKLKYKGYPDEVIQLIEAGNVSLETRSNLIGSTQSLFGVKAQFKLGPLLLTTIASQKRSEKKEVNITGGSVETPFEIPIWDYSETNYLLDETYDTIFTNYYANGVTTVDITEIEVWVMAEVNNPNKRAVWGVDTLSTRPANGYPPNDTLSAVDGRTLKSFFVKLDASEFTINRNAGYITLNGNLQALGKDAIAVAYTVNTSGIETQVGDYVRDVGSTDRMNLKLLRYVSQVPTYERLWKRMLKNIYHLGVRNIKNDPANLTFNVYYNEPGQPPNSSYNGEGNAQGKSYMNLIGLDSRVNGNPTEIIPDGDGYFDFFVNNTIDLVNGNVIIPFLRPFSETLRQKGVSEEFIGRNDTVYTSTKSTAQSFGFLKYVLKGVAKGDASSRYSLGFNLVEGSVKVFNGSVELTAGVDYSIDYSLGELLIINATALVAGTNLKITYETNDLFQLASKTLLGARAELQFNKTSYLGFTLINLKQQTLNDRVRIGEEPTNNTIFGFDASTDIKTNFLTKLLNKIPGYATKEESVLNLKGEIAFMLPDPNTLKSRIPSDKGESVAYIDDFEGVSKVIPFGLNPLSWTLSSVPVDPVLVPNFSNENERDSLMNRKRSKITWYNLLNNVPIKEVYPDRSVATNQNQTLTPLVLDIQPDTVGQYTYMKQSDFTNEGPASEKWSGIFRFLNTSQTNLIDENINYVEIWMQVNGGFPVRSDSAKMILDLGTISERIITTKKMPLSTTDPNINYHTEDINGSGQLDADEDNGIDGRPNNTTIINGVAVLGENFYFDSLSAETRGDPSRDDYFWVQGGNDYSSFNGTEKNATNLTEAKRIDTEDLNNNGNLDLINNYFEYVIPLDSSTFRNNPFVAGGGNAGWYQYIIPLDEWKEKVGENATFSNIQYGRVWFKGFEQTTRIKIVAFDLVGNQWVKADKTDTTYTVAVVNIEDNSNIYEPPVPGDILRQKDQSQVDQNVLSNEQSIVLGVRNLLPGQKKTMFKSFTTRPIDLVNYKFLKLFVNGDSTFNYVNEDIHDAEVIVRIGNDTSNFYEYRAPIHPDKRPGTPWDARNEVLINLSDLASVKQLQDSLNRGQVIYQKVIDGPPGAQYGVIGSPSIRNVSQISLGIENTNNDPIITKPLNGTVWFDEMRVLLTNNASGYAFTLNAGLKIADFATLNFSYNKTDPNFHTLENRFGSLTLANSWEISGQVNAGKIFNALLSKYVSVKFKDFFTLPVSFSHLEVQDKPEYLPATDVFLETAALNEYKKVLEETGSVEQAEYASNQLKISAQTLRVANRFSLTGAKFTFPGENFFVRQLLNMMEINFVWNSYTERTPSLESKYAWDMNGSIGLSSNLDVMKTLNLKIGRLLPFGEEFKDAKMYFFFPFAPLTPFFTDNISLSASYDRRRGDEQLRTQLNPNPTSRQFGATRGFNLNWKFLENWIVDVGGDYSFRAGSDLTYLETTNDSARTQRSESEILDDIFFNESLINWGKTLDYVQSVSINPKFNIPGLRNFVDLTASYRVNYGWRTSQYANDLGSTVGYSSDLQATSFFKLNQIFNIFKPGNKIMGGSLSGSIYQDDKQSLGDLLKLLGTFVPDQVNVTFAQTKLVTNPAVNNRPGFANFWMRLDSKENLGPSRLYQMGWETDPGARVPFLQITDGFTVNNTVTFNTFINPIFPNNLKLNFTYKTGTGAINALTYNTDSLGSVGTPIYTNSNRTITRPSFFISTSNITNNLAKPTSQEAQAKEISESFENNIVSFPFPSWTLSLTGAEKFEMFSQFAQSITIESGYTSEYRKVLRFDGINPEFITAQAITSGFTPLIGVNINFKPISDGTFTASFKLNETANLNMDPNNAKLTNTATNDLSINASYTKSGFNLPIFGLSLENNLTISFSYTKTKNDPVVYSYLPENRAEGIWDVNSQNGSTSTTLNPSIQYNLSRSVTLQLFYKYTKVEPTGNNLIITTRTANEAGLNVRLQIQ